MALQKFKTDVILDIGSVYYYTRMILKKIKNVDRLGNIDC